MDHVTNEVVIFASLEKDRCSDGKKEAPEEIEHMEVTIAEELHI